MAEVFALNRNGAFGDVSLTRYPLRDAAALHEEVERRTIAGISVLVPLSRHLSHCVKPIAAAIELLQTYVGSKATLKEFELTTVHFPPKLADAPRQERWLSSVETKLSDLRVCSRKRITSKPSSHELDHCGLDKG